MDENTKPKITINTGEIGFAEGQELPEDVTHVNDNVDGLLSMEVRDANNKFDQIIAPGFGQRFAQIMSANAIDRFWMMSSLVSYGNQSTLTDNKKKLLGDLEDSFLDACCVNGPSQRLMKLIEKKPNLAKMIKGKRLNRVYDTLALAPSRLGFTSTPTGNYLPLFFTAMAMSFGWEGLKKDMEITKTSGLRNPTGTLMAALLSKYANSISPYDYSGMWFVLMFIKNLSVCSIIHKEMLETNPELNDYAKNFFTLADSMIENCAKDFLEAYKVEYPKETPDMAKDSVPNADDGIVEIEV